MSKKSADPHRRYAKIIQNMVDASGVGLVILLGYSGPVQPNDRNLRQLLPSVAI